MAASGNLAGGILHSLSDGSGVGTQAKCGSPLLSGKSSQNSLTT